MHTFSTACNTRMRLSLAIFATSSSEYPRLISSANRLGNLDTSSRSTGTLSMTINNSSLTLQLLQCKDYFKSLRCLLTVQCHQSHCRYQRGLFQPHCECGQHDLGKKIKEKINLGFNNSFKSITCYLFNRCIWTAVDVIRIKVHHHNSSIVRLCVES